MAVAFRPLQPCLSLLLPRSLPPAHLTGLRVRHVQGATSGKIKHAFPGLSKVQAARCYSQERTSGPIASGSGGTEQVLSLAREAIPQTFSPYSVVRCGRLP